MITNPKTFFEQFQNFIEESGLQLKKFKSNLSNYFTKSEAIDTFLGKTDQAESAKKSDEAIKATQDSEGNVISSTYLKTNTASTTYLTQANASSTYLTKTGKAASASIADTAGSATKATQDAKGNVIDSTYLTKTDASSSYLGKTAKAESAKSADTATKATQDSEGNSIVNTYLKSSLAETTYLTKTDASNTYLGKTAKAKSAEVADKATKDSEGNTINATYVKSVNGSKPVNGNVTVDIPNGVHVGIEAPTDEETNVWVDPSASADIVVRSVNNSAPDANGNVNVDTSSFITKTTADASYLGKTAKATSATSADSATKATQDGNGANIASTYMKKSSITSGTTDMTAGTSTLATGSIYLMYE